MSIDSTDIRREWRRQDQLYRVGEEANEWRLSGRDLAASALQRAMTFTEATLGTVVVLRGDRRTVIACQGCSTTSETDLPAEIFDHSQVEKAFSGETIVVNPTSSDDRQGLSLLVVPLRACSRVIGVLALGKPKPAVFFVEHRRGVTTIAACLAPHLCEEAGELALCSRR